MTVFFDRKWKARGPFGMTVSDGCSNGRIPGVIGVSGQAERSGPPRHYIGETSESSGVAANKKGTNASVTKTFDMPAPAVWTTRNRLRPKMVPWELFHGKGAIKMGDIKQGEITNCPLPTILAAMANTAGGSNKIRSMISTHQGTVVTDLAMESEYTSGKIEHQKVSSSRYFKVVLNDGKTHEISDVFFMNDSDGKMGMADGPSLTYMGAPNMVIWGCVIEKAYAKAKGGYNEIDLDGNLSVSDVWRDVASKSYDILDLADAGRKKSQKDKDILAFCRRGSTQPMLAATGAATRTLGFGHGYVVLGVRGENILLYDAAALQKSTVTVDQFRNDVVQVLTSKI
jgi:hypothetical protein